MKTASLNTTAYRVIRMLQWLSETPMSTEDFNARFLQDPLIQKTLSEDSIWLYINTLKMLGCEISRPAPSNDYHYELLYQPFGTPLVETDIEVLAQVKVLGEKHLPYSCILSLDQFIKKILQLSTLEQRDSIVSELFSDTRSIDYESYMAQVEELEQVIESRKLLFVTYLSSMQGKECFYFLPQEICYQRGALLLKGSRLGYEQLVMLRVDRLDAYEATKGPALIYEQLKALQDKFTLVQIRLFDVTPATYQPLGPEEETHFVAEADSGEVGRAYMEVLTRTRDWFTLKQKLLESGLPFEVLQPQSYRADMLETLAAMQRAYGDGEDKGAGRD